VRRIAIAVLIAIVAVALTAGPVVAAQTISVTYAGPVTAGTELVLTCPEGYTGDPEAASFYRDPRGRVLLLSKEADRLIYSPSGDAVRSAVWTVPKGARYAEAVMHCFEMPPLPPIFSWSQEGVFTGDAVTFLCPAASHPYVVDAVVYGDEDGDLSTFPQYVLDYQVVRDPDGIIFTGPVGHAYRATINCATTAP
jgi:hypothetical protein